MKEKVKLTICSNASKHCSGNQLCILSVLHKSLALSSWCKYSMRLFSALSPDICKIVGKTQINCLIRKHKIIFPVERIRFNTACTPCTGARYVRLVPLLTQKPMKCQVHKRAPAVVYCSTERSRGKWCLMGYHPAVRTQAVRSHRGRRCAAAGGWGLRTGRGAVSSVPIGWQTAGTPRKVAARLPASPPPPFWKSLSCKMGAVLSSQTYSRCKISHPL